MNKEDKELLFQDLCARLPYDVYVLADIYKTFDGGIIGNVVGVNLESGLVYLEGVLTPFYIDEIKPYLRSMSSMTEEEKDEFYNNSNGNVDNRTDGKGLFFRNNFVSFEDINYTINWLNAHHFDYRGLIPKGLAIEVTEENNPY